jgi:hypothetical protein
VLWAGAAAADQSKIDLAVQQIEAFTPPQATHTHEFVDSWYHCTQVRKAAQQRGWDFSGGLKSNRVMRLIAEDGQREWLKLADCATRLTRDDWQEVVWSGEAGGQKVYAHLVKSWIRKPGPTLVLITCHDLDAPRPSLRYWGSTQLELTHQELVDTLAVRWKPSLSTTRTSWVAIPIRSCRHKPFCVSGP